jgi:hypothetical protein
MPLFLMPFATPGSVPYLLKVRNESFHKARRNNHSHSSSIDMSVAYAQCFSYRVFLCLFVLLSLYTSE